MDPTVPPPAKKFCASLRPDNIKLAAIPTNHQLPKLVAFNTAVYSNAKQSKNATTIGIQPQSKTSNTNSEKTGDSVNEKDAGHEMRAKKIKLRTHDGKDLGEVTIQFTSKQATSLNGKLLKLTKASTFNKINKAASIKSVSSKEKKVQPTIIVPKTKLAVCASPTVLPQLVPVAVPAIKLITQPGTVLKVQHASPPVTGATSQNAETTDELEKITQYYIKRNCNSQTEKPAEEKNTNQGVKKSQTGTIAVMAMVPKLTKIAPLKNMVVLGNKGNSEVTSDASLLKNKVIIKKSMPKSFLYKSKPILNVQKQPVNQATCTDVKTAEFKPLLIKVNSSNLQQPLLLLNNNTVQQIPGSGKINVNNNQILLKDSIIPAGNKSKAKSGKNIAVPVMEKNSPPKNILSASQKNQNNIPIQNVVPMLAELKNPENSSGNTSKNIIYPVKVEEPGNVSVKSVDGEVDYKIKETSKKADVVQHNDNSVPVVADKIKTEVRENQENLSIIGEALNNVTDADLRKKALKALNECGIIISKPVPISPPQPTKVVHETMTQTELFSLLDKDSLILVRKDSTEIERIEETKVVESKITTQQDASIQVQSSPPCAKMNDFDSLPWSASFSRQLENIFDMENFFDELCNESPDASKVKEILSEQNSLQRRIIARVQQDYQSLKQWDQDGTLNIHRAVINNNLCNLARILVILKACKENIDVETASGKTSLELAISSHASPAIIKALLSAGASPISKELARDTAVILASKMSSPILTELINYVKDPSLLNNKDSEGLAPLHYCAMHGNMEGVRAILNAGADVNLRDNRSGRTALFHATENNHILVGQLLLEYGANGNIENFAGQTVIPLLDDAKNVTLKSMLNKVT